MSEFRPDTSNTLKEQLNQLYQSLPTTLLALILVSSLTMLVLKEVPGTTIAWGWYVLIWLVTILRLLDLWVYRTASRAIDLHRCYLRFFAGAFATGLLWMATVFIFYDPQQTVYAAFLVTVLAGVSAGAVVSLSYLRAVSISYILVFLIPLAIRLLGGDSDVNFYFGIMILMFIVFLINAANVFYRNNAQNIQLRLKAIEDEATLRESENRYRLIFDNAPLGILYFTANGSVMTVNQEAVQITGVKKEGFSGYNLLQSPAESIVESINEAYRDGASFFEGSACELIGELPTPIRVFFAVVFGVRDDIGGIAIIEDITVSKKVEKLKNEFVSTVSHELRTPLTAIIGGLLILEKHHLKDDEQKIIEIARRNSESLLRIINDILDIDKIELGEMDFDITRYALVSLVRRTLAENEILARKKSINMALHAPAEEVDVMVDSARFRQALTNLLINAIKFSPQGGEVIVSIESMNSSVRISVRDSGKGVSDHFRDKIFNKFSQDDSSDRRQYSGAGLGLYITRMITEKLGGRVDFFNHQDGGAVFYIDLPISQCYAE